MAIITCRHFDKFLDDYLAGRLSLLTRWQFRAHLTLCPPCKRYLDEYRRTVEAAQQLGSVPTPSAPMPPELAESITRLLSQTSQTDRSE